MGQKNEVMAIIDPNNSLWQYYGGITGDIGWVEADSWTESIEWVDANTNDYINGLRNPLERVK